MEEYNRAWLLPKIKDDEKRIARKKPLSFQIVTFSETMEAYEENSPGGILSDGVTEADPRLRYVPQIIGVTENGSSVLINVFGFCPYFYIKCPDRIGDKKWSDRWVDEIEEFVKSELGFQRRHLMGFEVQKKRSFRGFTNYKLFNYIKISIDNDSLMQKLVNKFRRGVKLSFSKQPIVFGLADTKISSILKFIHSRDLDTGGWVKIAGYNEVETKLSKVNYEINVDIENVVKLIKPDKAPMVKMSWDIEVNSKDGHSFPVPEIKENRVFMISSNFRVEGTKQSALKVILTLKECDAIKPKEALSDHVDQKFAIGTKVIIFEFEKESELLRYWIKLVNDMDPDYVYGFNSFGFDHEYIGDRAYYLDNGSLTDTRELKARLTEMSKKETSLCNAILNMGRLNKKDEWFTKMLSSAALGNRKMSYNTMSGRVLFDVMHAVATARGNLSQYSLDFCANTILGTNKKDLPPPELFRMYQSGKSHEMKIIAVYCIVDSEIPHDLVDKLNIIWSSAAVATVSSVPQEYIFVRGQTIKIGSYCSKICSEKNVGFDDIIASRGTKKYRKWYEGAYVMDAKPLFYDDPVYVCDFNSLYPSEEIGHDLSQDTLVEIGGKYDGLEGVKYTDFDIPCKRLVPNLPEFADRKTGKAAELEAEEELELEFEDDSEPDIEEPFDGANAGTKKQRDQDKKIKKVSPQDIDKIVREFKESGGSYEDLPDNSETSATIKTKKGAEPTERQMATFEKKMKKIFEEFPSSITLRDELSKLMLVESSLEPEWLDEKIPINKAKIVITTRRVRFAHIDEHKGVLPEILIAILLARAETREKIKYNDSRIARHEMRIKNNRDGLITKIEADITKVSSSKKWTKGFVADMMNNLTAELTREKQNTPYVVEELEMDISTWNKENDNYENLQNAFKVTANSFYGQCGSDFSMIACIEVAAATTAAGQMDIKLAANVVEAKYPNDEVVYGDTDSIFVRCRAPEIREKFKKYKIPDDVDPIAIKARKDIASKKKANKDTSDITDSEIAEHIKTFSDDDLEKIKKDYIQERLDEALILNAMQHAIDGSVAINAAIARPPMNIAFEKVIYPYIQFTPKRYKGLFHTDPKNPLDSYVKTMGLVDKKRDNCDYTRKCFRQLTEGMLALTPYDQLKKMFARQVKDLLDGNVDPKDLVITKKIGQDYKATPPAHVLCANRIKERQDPIQYHVNDRIPYVILLTEDLSVHRTMSKAPKLPEMIEGFHYAIEHELELNYLYYMSNVCMAPLLDTMKLIMDDPLEIVRKVAKKYAIPKWFRINWAKHKHAL